MKLIDRIAPNNQVNLNETSIEKQSMKANTAFALNRVVEKLIGIESKDQKFKENRHYTDILQTLDREKTPQQIAILNQGKADLVLIALPKGVIRAISHVEFESYWNAVSDKDRGLIHVIRSYWLGEAFEFDLEEVKASETPIQSLNETISNRLIDDIVNFVRLYKENPKQMRCTVNHHGRDVKDYKGTWRDRYIVRWSGVGMKSTTYLYPLLMSLVKDNKIPSDIPEDCLTFDERKAILEKINPKPSKDKENGK
jgi:hypothetical protein